MKKNKLYIWEGVLTDWSPGMVVCLAKSKKEALKYLEGLPYELSESSLLELKNTKPSVYSVDRKTSVGAVVYGGG